MKLYNGTGRLWMLSVLSLIGISNMLLQLRSAIRHGDSSTAPTIAVLLLLTVSAWITYVRVQRWLTRVDEQLETKEKIDPKVLNKMSFDNYSLSQLVVITAMIGSMLYHVPKH